MTARSARHQNRHFRTLITLVLSMTAGTFLLFWVNGLSITQPRSLRGVPAAAKAWREIAVRTADPRKPAGYYHFRIDQAGRTYERPDWQNQHNQSGAIQIVVTGDEDRPRLSDKQSQAFQRLITDLRREHSISQDRISAPRSFKLARG